MSAPMPARPAGATAGDALDGIILLTERLSALIMEESRLLAAGNTQPLADKQEEKHRLVARYASEMAKLNGNPSLLAQAHPAKRAHLREVTGKFRSTIEDHARRVGAMKTVSERMIKAVGDEVTRRNRPVRGYDEKALMRPAMSAGMAPRPTSVALNQVI